MPDVTYVTYWRHIQIHLAVFASRISGVTEEKSEFSIRLLCQKL